MLLNAHIFKRRSRGEREEVRIKLFNPDGSDYEGGGGSSAQFYGGSNSSGVVDNDGIGLYIPMGNTFASTVEGFTLDEDGHLHAEQGAYAVQLEGDWTNLLANPASGHLDIRLVFVYGENNNEHLVINHHQTAAKGVDSEVRQLALTITPDAGYFVLFADQNVQPGESAPSFAGWVTIIKL